MCQRVERSYEWRYLQVAVDPLSGEVWWRWSARLGKEAAVAALSEWRALGVAVVVWGTRVLIGRVRCERLGWSWCICLRTGLS